MVATEPLRTADATGSPAAPSRRSTPEEAPAAPVVPALLAVAAAVVPCLFTTRVTELYLLPKLVALWAVLVLALNVLAAGVAAGRSPGSAARASRAIDIALAAFVATNLVAFALSTDRRQSLFGERSQYQGLLTLFLYLGFFLLARFVVTDLRRMVLLLTGIVAGTLAVAGYAVAQRAGLDPRWQDEIPNGRVFSTIGQPNALGAYLVVATCASIGLFHLTSTPRRWAVLAVVALAVMALALTGSRGGYLALLVSLAVLGAIGGLRRPGRRALAGLVLAAACLGALALVGPLRQGAAQTWQRALSSTDVRGDTSIRDRLDLWRVALHIALDHPLAGTGQETFPDRFPRASEEVLPADRVARLSGYRVESAHNVPLTMAATTGLPSVLAYLALLACSAWYLLRAARASTDRRVGMVLVAVLAGVTGHTVAGLFMTPELTGTWLTWVVLGAGLGLAAHARAEALTGSRLAGAGGPAGVGLADGAGPAFDRSPPAEGPGVEPEGCADGRAEADPERGGQGAAGDEALDEPSHEQHRDRPHDEGDGPAALLGQRRPPAPVARVDDRPPEP